MVSFIYGTNTIILMDISNNMFLMIQHFGYLLWYFCPMQYSIKIQTKSINIAAENMYIGLKLEKPKSDALKKTRNRLKLCLLM